MPAVERNQTARAEPPRGLPDLTPLDRLRLAGEVLRTYAEVRRWMVAGGLPDTVESLRGDLREQPQPAGGRLAYWQGIRLGKATARVLRLLPSDSRCLMQSLVLLGLLARRGIDSTLVVAVRSGPPFEAHAWVEHDRRPLLPAWRDGRLVEL